MPSHPVGHEKQPSGVFNEIGILVVLPLPPNVCHAARLHLHFLALPETAEAFPGVLLITAPLSQLQQRCLNL